MDADELYNRIKPWIDEFMEKCNIKELYINGELRNER